MIECVIKNGCVLKFNAIGSCNEVASEIGLAINRTYSALYKQTLSAAEFWKQLITIMMLPDSPVWQIDSDIEGIFIVREVPK